MEEFRELSNYLKPEQMPEDMATLLRLVGGEGFLAIYECFQGEQLYIARNSLDSAISSYLRDHPDVSYRRLARALHRGARQVQRLVSAKPQQVQYPLFEEEAGNEQ